MSFCTATRRFRNTRWLKKSKNRKCTERPQNYFRHVMVNTTLYIHVVGIYPRGPNLCLFRSTTGRFQKYKVVENRKNRKCTESPRTDLEHLTVKGTPYTLYKYPEGQIRRLFALRSTFSRNKVVERWQNRKCSERHKSYNFRH